MPLTPFSAQRATLVNVQESLRTLDDVVTADVKVWTAFGTVVVKAQNTQEAKRCCKGGEDGLCAASVLAGGDRRVSRRPAG